MSISPVAGLEPYGHTAQGPLEDGPLKYDSMFFMADSTVAQNFEQISIMPAGSYARIGCFRPWNDMKPTHRQLMAYVESLGANPHATRYEYSCFGLFDSASTSDFDNYRCIVAMPLQ